MGTTHILERKEGLVAVEVRVVEVATSSRRLRGRLQQYGDDVGDRADQQPHRITG